jgi:hypothetical protein
VRRRDTHPAWTRIALAGMVIAAVLAVFGLPLANLHGPLHYVGVMDPLSGGTRSVYLTLRGRLHEAIRYNPAGPPTHHCRGRCPDSGRDTTLERVLGQCSCAAGVADRRGGHCSDRT